MTLTRTTALGLGAIAALFAASLAAPSPAAALTKEKVNVIGVPDDMERIKGTKCVFAGVCFSKKANAFTYDPGVWGMAKFREGEVTLRDGTVLTGRVATLSLAADWEFVKRVLLVIPEGEVDAIFIGSDDAVLIKQQVKKGERVFDRYDGAYLQRLVSGEMRLSYNPAAGTSRPISDFVPVSLLSNMAGAAGRQAVMSSLKDGKTVSQSLESGRSFGSAVSDAIGSIEITEKEYLLYDESADAMSVVTKANYESAMARLFDSCTAADAKTRKGFRKFKKIVEAVEFHNARC
ncbi:hypothetical protein [Erythrobacter sp. F6033]|uniref:hypothetical protein n=1 Tax=Erythrobacter sp. F6033 TaxID=2926401 RepID=UPI001FF66A9C|nr:hypothetical protein [Erythrobacter sp. F6033]MCK0127437.1 hypothetical protein [Erythrobacter sp. F6033]